MKYLTNVRSIVPCFTYRALIRLVLVAPLLVLASVQPGYAQTATSGSIAGTAADQQGGVLPGVSVTAVHVPTGTSYEAVTGGDGSFTIPNVRVGGPYTVKATLAGFREVILPDKTGRVERHFVVLCFAAHYRAGTATPNEELAELRWVDPAEVSQLRTTEGLAEIIAEAVEKLGKP